MKEFENIINTAWDNKDSINGQSDQSILNAIKETIELVDKGVLRVAEKKDNEWVVHQWIKKAILLSFKTNEMQTLAGPYATWWDKVRGKTAGWGREEHKKAGFRMVPNGVVRHGSFIGKNVVLMPSFVNIGAYVACWLENDEVFAKKDADKPYIDYKIKNLPSFLQEINILKAQ